MAEKKVGTYPLRFKDEALDFPVLDGKSVRERFNECRFFVE